MTQSTVIGLLHVAVLKGMPIKMTGLQLITCLRFYSGFNFILSYQFETHKIMPAYESCIEQILFAVI